MSHKNIKLVNNLAIFILLPFLWILSDCQVAHTQSLSETEETQEQVIRTRVNFQPPSDNVPEGSEPGGSRSDLALLLPGSFGALGLTTKAKPTFFIYSRESEIQTVDFILIDRETQEPIYEASIKLSINIGIIAIPLPIEAPSLEVGKTYIIVFQNRGSFISGLIKRVELNPTLNSQLESAYPLEKAILYADNGIGFETLEILNELKRSQPENETFATEWTELLKSVGLDAI